MSRLEENIGRLLKETGQCVKAEWERERKEGGVEEGGGSLFALCPGLKPF